jgi:demethylmenaquinone methyltransferase/2-methoxy-6-polyprenyl-1,4-benzoquinol methylase
MVARIMSEERPGGTGFGYRQVAEDDRQGLVNEVFAKVAHRYDQMNDLMSAGLHRLWKDDFVTLLALPRGSRPFHVLDLAGGTGDIAFRIAKTGGPAVEVTVADMSPEMVAVGAHRARTEMSGRRCRFILANAEALPFSDKSFDACTIAFGIRNVTHIDRALAEAFRVLKPGGKFQSLEFSHVDVPGLDVLYEAYSMTAIPAMGKVVTGDGAPYRYLVESIRTFPDQESFAHIISAAGFARVGYRNLSGGIVAIHWGWRI